MFLRKLLVIVVPLVLCGLCVFFLPLLLAGMGRAKSVDAFEIQPDMADMARRSVRLNGLEHIIRIHALPVESADEVLAPGSIDVIVCNPPYGHHGTTLPNPAQTLSLALPFQPVSGCTMMIECTFLSFMTVQAIRTKT